jgi:hypothetical protein
VGATRTTFGRAIGSEAVEAEIPASEPVPTGVLSVLTPDTGAVDGSPVTGASEDEVSAVWTTELPADAVAELVKSAAGEVVTGGVESTLKECTTSVLPWLAVVLPVLVDEGVLLPELEGRPGLDDEVLFPLLPAGSDAPPDAVPEEDVEVEEVEDEESSPVLEPAGGGLFACPCAVELPEESSGSAEAPWPLVGELPFVEGGDDGPE